MKTLTFISVSRKLPSMSVERIVTLEEPGVIGFISKLVLLLLIIFSIEAMLGLEIEMISCLIGLIDIMLSTITILSSVKKFGFNPSVVGKSFKIVF